MEHEIVTRCGMRCDLCIAYIHHPDHPDMEKRRRASDVWEQYLGFRLEPGEIECGGCLDEDRFLDKECPVRPCVVRRAYTTCAQCDEFDGCEIITDRLISEAGYGDRRWGVLPDGDRQYLEAFMNQKRLADMRKRQTG